MQKPRQVRHEAPDTGGALARCLPSQTVVGEVWAQCLQQRIGVHLWWQFDIHLVGDNATFVKQFGLLQRGERHIHTRLDESRSHRLTRDLFEPAGNRQRERADLDGVASLRIKLQEQAVIDDRLPASAEGIGRRCWFGLQRPIVREVPLQCPDLHQARRGGLWKVGHRRTTDFARLITTKLSEECFCLGCQRLPTSEDEIST